MPQTVPVCAVCASVLKTSNCSCCVCFCFAVAFLVYSVFVHICLIVGIS